LDKILNEVLLYAEKNKIRMLIEVGSDHKEMDVYSDTFSIQALSNILSKIQGIKINYISSNFHIKYEYYPSIVHLDRPVVFAVYRAWHEIPFEIVEIGDKKVYFMELPGTYTDQEKASLKAIVEKIDVLKMDLHGLQGKMNSEMKKAGLPEIYFNVYGNGIAFYK
jgi:hypothetical protein